MDNFKKLKRQTTFLILGALLLSNVLLACFWLTTNMYHTKLSKTSLLVGSAAIMIGFAFIIARSLTRAITVPLEATWKAIVHVSSKSGSVGAPNIENITLGRELLASLIPQVYQLASTSLSGVGEEENRIGTQTIENSALGTLPLPVILVSSESKISFANDCAVKYFSSPNQPLAVGSDINESLNIMFPGSETFEQWLNECAEKTITATKTWERVRVVGSENEILHQGDMVGYFNKGLGDNLQSSIVFFDRSERYMTDDQGVGFIALAVHELRTPLTMMRGYVEVFEDELEGRLNPELQDFMKKLSASAQQLTAFVNNILNVARVEENQLVLHLEEYNLSDIIKSAAADMEIRAAIRQKQIEYKIRADLPTVAADRMSICEVIENVLDNAIKYSGGSKKIIIDAHQTKDGFVETTIQDFGNGMPSTALGHIFDKFYRNNRSSDQASGSGLGLYLAKTIVEAHGGQITVNSKEGEGTIIGFTLQKFQDVAKDSKNSTNEHITRVAHGWIKNQL